MPTVPNFRLALITVSDDGRLHVPYNDVAPSDYAFYSVVSEHGLASELRHHAKALGHRRAGISRSVAHDKRNWRTPDVTAYLPLDVPCDQWGRSAVKALAWVRIPVIDGLPARAEIGPMSDDLFDAAVRCGNDDDLGVATFGDDVDGKAAVIISGWHFYHVAPLLGYTWQSVLRGYGVEGDDDTIAPFGFDDDSDACGECGVIDNRDDGYTYNFRYIEATGSYLGINCGCYHDAERKHWADKCDDSEQAIPLDLARELARAGKLQFVERFIGGWTDPGRGGYFRVDDDEPDAAGDSVRNGVPSEELARLQAAEPCASFIFSSDETGQFQQYFSVWRVVAEHADEAA